MNKDLEKFDLPNGTFGFSAVGLDELGASEYTLVTLVVDVSSSVASYKKSMEDAIKSVVNSCKYSQRADNLLIRFLVFNNKISEVHGFKLLEQCLEDDYSNCLNTGGMTSLYDATHNAVEATNSYAQNLSENDFSVNSIVVVITDGMDNMSSCGSSAVKQSITAALKDEYLESMVSILIGVGVGDSQEVSDVLSDFAKQAGMTQYIEIKDANKQTLAKLAQFVSKSISAQSQSLQNGISSSPLSF